MPTRELQPYVAMLPVIQAQQAMAAAEQVAVGVRGLPPAAHRDVLTRWRRVAAQGSRPATLDARQLATMTRSSGIGYRVVEAKAAQP